MRKVRWIAKNATDKADILINVTARYFRITLTMQFSATELSMITAANRGPTVTPVRRSDVTMDKRIWLPVVRSFGYLTSMYNITRFSHVATEDTTTMIVPKV